MLQDIKQFRQDYRVLIQTLVGFVVLALVMTGVGGTVYRMIAPEGWLVQWFGTGVTAATAAVVSLLAIAALSWFTREWVSAYQKNRLADVLIYVFAGAGVVYLAQILMPLRF
jgi:integral membrane sensor domain MASE1